MRGSLGLDALLIECEGCMPKTVYQVVQLPAAPRTLYSMYLDPQRHAAFTGGGAVQITAMPGTEWSAFDGRIHGRLLALTPEHEIVQSWRSFEWQADDPDSTLILTFWPEGIGARVELTQENVPDRLYENLVVGWPNRYWNPWRAYLERRG
jgi:activator of HSP90 ATPase